MAKNTSSVVSDFLKGFLFNYVIYMIDAFHCRRSGVFIATLNRLHTFCFGSNLKKANHKSKSIISPKYGNWKTVRCWIGMRKTSPFPIYDVEQKRNKILSSGVWTPTYNTQSPPVFPNDNPNLKRLPSFHLGIRWPPPKNNQ